MASRKENDDNGIIRTMQELDGLLENMPASEMLDHLREPFDKNLPYLLQQGTGKGMLLTGIDQDDERITRLSHLDENYSPDALQTILPGDTGTGLSLPADDDEAWENAIAEVREHQDCKLVGDHGYVCICGEPLKASNDKEAQDALTLHMLHESLNKLVGAQK